jgi:hypothetical protein
VGIYAEDVTVIDREDEEEVSGRKGKQKGNECQFRSGSQKEADAASVHSVAYSD